jgi:hypothetical protein
MSTAEGTNFNSMMGPGPPNPGQSSALRSIINGYGVNAGVHGHSVNSSFGHASFMRKSAFGSSAFPDQKLNNSNNKQDFYNRMGSTLTSVGNHMVNKLHANNNNSGRQTYRSA